MAVLSDYNFKGKKALIRVDFNVPLNEQFEITDDSRIKAAIPTIKSILNQGGAVILMSHLGRPKGEKSEKYSLKHTLENLNNHLACKVTFMDDCIGEKVEKAAKELQAGEVLLLENLRFYREEEAGDPHFSKRLADLGDVLEAVSRVIENNARPFTAIMGGAKISDKILLIEKMLDKVDHLIIGGGMSYTFFKALGGNVGNSLVEEDKVSLAKTILDLAKEKNVQLLLPEDSIIADSFSNEANLNVAKNLTISEGWMGLDIGPKAINEFSELIKKSKTILWNGPMGVFEMSNFEKGTKGVAEAIVEATENGAYSLIGGGDSAAAIHQFNLGEKVSYISTGGGALLEYLEGKTLPGIKAIQG